MRLKILLIIYFVFFNYHAKADWVQDSKVWKFFSGIANDAVENFPKVPFLQGEVKEGIKKFGKATYVGELKKGMANGYGVFAFSDGTKYVGKFKRNMFHGNGIYTDLEGNSFEGKWKYNKFTKPINNKTREVIQLSKAFGKSNFYEIRGEGELWNQWFEAETSIENTAELPLVKELDIFDKPTVFSKHYGDEKKIQEILDKKNSEIISQNNLSSQIKSNLKTVYVLTVKGKKDMEIKQSIVNANSTPSLGTTGHSGGSMMSGGGGC